MHRTVRDRRIKALEQVQERIKYRSRHDGPLYIGDKLAGKRLAIAQAELATLQKRIGLS